MFTIDTNVFVRDIDTRDPEHPSCHALLEALQARQAAIICPHILLPEVAGAVRRTWQDVMRSRLAARFVSELPNLYCGHVGPERARAAPVVPSADLQPH